MYKILIGEYEDKQTAVDVLNGMNSLSGYDGWIVDENNKPVFNTLRGNLED